MTDNNKIEEMNEAELDQITGGALLLPAVQAARETYSGGSSEKFKKSDNGNATALDALRVINRINTRGH